MEIEKENDKKQSEQILTTEQQMDKMEDFIMKTLKLPVPLLIFRLSSNDKPNNKWSHDDMYEFASQFGKVEDIEISGNSCYVLFEKYFNAYIFKNFLDKKENLNDPQNEKFTVRWFQQEDEHLMNDILEAKKRKMTLGSIVENINTTMLNSNQHLSRSSQIVDDGETHSEYSLNLKAIKKENIASSSYAQYVFYSKYSLPLNARKELENLMITNHKKSYPLSHNLQYSNSEPTLLSQENPNSNENGLPNVKFYCKFFVQIESEPEFNITRRIVGANGCNIKRIIDYCSKGFNGHLRATDSLKIRLRGKGSGYKEGPYNREWDEPLQICVSSKYLDKYRKACSFVQELLINIYEEYKRFCERNGKIPVNNMNNLTIQKIESISTNRK